MVNSDKYTFVLKSWLALGFLIIGAILLVLHRYDLIEFTKTHNKLELSDQFQVDHNRERSVSEFKQSEKEMPFGSIELLKHELKESLSYSFEVNTSDKELGIKVFFDKSTLSNRTNAEMKLIITHIFSAMHAAKYDQYDSVELKIVAPLLDQNRNHSQTNIVTARYDQPVVKYLPWHEIKHVDMYHIANKLELHPGLQ